MKRGTDNVSLLDKIVTVCSAFVNSLYPITLMTIIKNIEIICGFQSKHSFSVGRLLYIPEADTFCMDHEVYLVEFEIILINAMTKWLVSVLKISSLPVLIQNMYAKIYSGLVIACSDKISKQILIWFFYAKIFKNRFSAVTKTWIITINKYIEHFNITTSFIKLHN